MIFWGAPISSVHFLKGSDPQHVVLSLLNNFCPILSYEKLVVRNRKIMILLVVNTLFLRTFNQRSVSIGFDLTGFWRGKEK